MFHFLCKTSLLCLAKCSIRTSLSQNLQFLKNPVSISWQPLKLLSNDTKQDTFIVSYLINQLGFSKKSALSASSSLHFQTPDKPDSLIAFLGNHGFSEIQIRRLVRKDPQILRRNPSSILPKIEFFISKGLSRCQVAEMLTAHSHLLLRGLASHLIPGFDFIAELTQSTEKAIAAVRSCPLLLYRDPDDYTRPTVSILQENGVPLAKILLFLRYRPDATLPDLSKLREIVKTVKEMGINPCKSQFVVAVVVLRAVGKDKWERKMEIYKKWGLTEEEIMTAFGKYPWFMVASEDKIMAAMDLFVNQMGLETSVIAKWPSLVQLSLKKKIIPRAAVFQFLLSKGALKKEHSRLYVYFTYSEERFMKRFVNVYQEAPELLKLYKEKLESP